MIKFHLFNSSRNLDHCAERVLKICASAAESIQRDIPIHNVDVAIQHTPGSQEVKKNWCIPTPLYSQYHMTGPRLQLENEIGEKKDAQKMTKSKQGLTYFDDRWN